MRKTCQQHFEKKINFFSGGGKTTCSWRERPGKIAEFRDALQPHENALQRVRFPETHDYAIFAFGRVYGPLNGLGGLPGGGTCAGRMRIPEKSPGNFRKSGKIPGPPSDARERATTASKGLGREITQKIVLNAPTGR